MDRTLAPTRVYGLSFRPPSVENGIQYPELVCTVSKDTAYKLETILTKRSERLMESVKAYLSDADMLWQDPQFSLGFGFVRHFGYNACGYVQELDTESRYHFPLVPNHTEAVALTLSHMFLFLDLDNESTPETERVGSNRQQLMTFTTRCEHVVMGWGHIISGYAYPALRAWLSNRGIRGDNDPLSSVRDAMKIAYVHLNPEHAELLVGMCDARLHSSGRFLLECPGNACDVAIYPDNDFGPETDGPTQISCHNLDSAMQQLTLLVGLAALHQLAEADLG